MCDRDHLPTGKTIGGMNIVICDDVSLSDHFKATPILMSLCTRATSMVQRKHTHTCRDIAGHSDGCHLCECGLMWHDEEVPHADTPATTPK